MNTEDISNRIKRLYLSVGETLDEDVPKHVNIKHEKTATGGTITISFSRKEDELALLNQIFSVISHLAKLKDHLKKKFSSKGGDPKLIEEEIDESEHLQLIIDLDNLEKHGSGRKSRSGKYPKIIDVGRGFSQKDIKSSVPAVFEFSTSGHIKWNDNTVIVISAKVIDKDGKYICSFTELVSKSTDKWEEIIKAFDLAV